MLAESAIVEIVDVRRDKSGERHNVYASRQKPSRWHTSVTGL